MKLLCVLACLLVCIQFGVAYGAETSADQFQSISETAIRWFIFDEWGQERGEELPPGSWGADMLDNMRERLKKGSATLMPVEIYIEKGAHLSGTFDMTSRILDFRNDVHAAHGNLRCIQINISPNATHTWDIKLQYRSIVASIVIAKNANGYYVSSFTNIMMFDW